MILTCSRVFGFSVGRLIIMPVLLCISACEHADGAIVFSDVTKETGITFKHSDGSSGQRYIVESVSSGLALFDYDRDGDVDIYFLNGSSFKKPEPDNPAKNALYRNEGNWKFTDNVSAIYKDYSSGGEEDIEFNAYVKDLKVGDSPQTSFTLTATVFPVNGLSLAVTGYYYADHYSAWNPFDRTVADEIAIQPWKIPSYSVFELHLNYLLPIKAAGIGFEVFGHVFNLLDEEYVSDATDNSAYNAYGVKAHKADDAEVYFGIPQYFNLGLRLTF